MYMFESGQLVDHDDHGLVEIKGSIIKYTDEIDVEPDNHTDHDSEAVIIGGKGVEEYIEFTPDEDNEANVEREPIDQFVRSTVGIDAIGL